MERNSLVVNLFSGPGSGKSTMAAYVFALLKFAGRDVELVMETYKDIIWGQEIKAGLDQVYVQGKQHFRIGRLLGEVDFVLVDSPLALQTVYAGDNQALIDLGIQEHKKLNSWNVFVNRVVPYSPIGRIHEGPEAIEIDNKTKEMLERYDIPYITLDGSKEGGETLAAMLLDMPTHAPYEEED